MIVIYCSTYGLRFFKLYRLYFARKIRIQVAQLKRLSAEGRFFCFMCLQWVVRCTTVVGCVWSADASIVQVLKSKTAKAVHHPHCTPLQKHLTHFAHFTHKLLHLPQTALMLIYKIVPANELAGTISLI
jgi:hypothetical protein